MNKALEILNALDNLLFVEEIKGVTEFSVGFKVSFRKNVQEAISELEEAIKPKTCKDCIHGAEDMQAIHCVFCSRSCDDKFEPKEDTNG